MPENNQMYGRSLERPPWVFLSNHGYILLAIAEEPTARVRDIAFSVGITERAAMRIIRELVMDGYLECSRVGRRNVYRVDHDAPLRHPTWSGRRVHDLLELVRPGAEGGPSVAHPGLNGLAMTSLESS